MEDNKISKTVDLDNWYTTQSLITILEQRWGKILIDRFTSDISRKSKRFNSKYLCSETEDISNVFSFDWWNEANHFVPLTLVITRAIKHFLKSTMKRQSTNHNLFKKLWQNQPLYTAFKNIYGNHAKFVPG